MLKKCKKIEIFDVSLDARCELICPLPEKCCFVLQGVKLEVECTAGG